jgi:hypothetical protein
MKSFALTPVESNKEAEFTGVYYAHWEGSGIEIDMGRWLIGLLPRREYWSAQFPPDFKLPFYDTAVPYRIRFIGTPSERGCFGHMGMCCRTVRIRQVSEFKVIEKKKAWTRLLDAKPSRP